MFFSKTLREATKQDPHLLAGQALHNPAFFGGLPGTDAGMKVLRDGTGTAMPGGSIPKEKPPEAALSCGGRQSEP